MYCDYIFQLILATRFSLNVCGSLSDRSSAVLVLRVMCCDFLVDLCRLIFNTRTFVPCNVITILMQYCFLLLLQSSITAVYVLDKYGVLLCALQWILLKLNLLCGGNSAGILLELV